MNTAEIRTLLVAIYDEAISSPDGVGRREMVETFNGTHPDAKLSIGSDLFDALLSRLAGEIISAHDGGSVVQPQLDGMELPATVTVPDGIGGYRRKMLRNSTVADLQADWEIQQQNLAGARRAFLLSDRAKKTLIPVMEAHGLRTAGESLDWMKQHPGEAA